MLSITSEKSFWRLETEPITDEYGNEIEKGVFVVTNGKFYLLFTTNGRILERIDQVTFNPYKAG
ncbi:MAG: hypothetical protein DHS20C18_41780 [Saprospiraceae bacterium]|nr:MAG: hypothetical protein DHS20C18_41780 [Saprospiraceae bacterium]